MGVVFFIAGIGLFLILLTYVISFRLIPKFARNRGSAWVGYTVAVLGIPAIFFYYPIYKERLNNDLIMVQTEHLKKYSLFSIYKTANNVTGVYVEDSYGRGRYQPWNRPFERCYKGTCDPMLPNEEDPVFAIRRQTIDPHSRLFQAVSGIHFFGCRTTIYNRSTGEVLARESEYSGACSNSMLSDQIKHKFQSVLVPLPLDAELTSELYDLAPGTRQKKASNSCESVGTISIAPGFNASNIDISRRDLALIVTLSTGDSLECATYFWADQSFRYSDIPVIKFSDGSTLSQADINRRLGITKFYGHP